MHHRWSMSGCRPCGTIIAQRPQEKEKVMNAIQLGVNSTPRARSAKQGRAEQSQRLRRSPLLGAAGSRMFRFTEWRARTRTIFLVDRIPLLIEEGTYPSGY